MAVSRKVSDEHKAVANDWLLVLNGERVVTAKTAVTAATTVTKSFFAGSFFFVGNSMKRSRLGFGRSHTEGKAESSAHGNCRPSESLQGREIVFSWK